MTNSFARMGTGTLSLPRAMALLIGTALLAPAPLEAVSVSDKPLPVLFGATKKAKLLYTATGILDSTDFATSFQCTSTERTGGPTITVGVQLFDENGVVESQVDQADDIAVIPPGNTRTISTRATPTFSGEVSLDSPGLQQASARIRATSKKLICTAYLVEQSGPSISITTVPLFRALKQKGS